MKTLILALCLGLSLLTAPAPGRGADSSAAIDPCALMAGEKVLTAFPALVKMERRTVGPIAVCNFLDRFGIPALMVTVGQAGPGSARAALALLGDGYAIEDLPGLGDEAAVAVQQANPRFGLKEGVAMLHVKKGQRFLELAPVRLEIGLASGEWERLRGLAAEMLDAL